MWTKLFSFFTWGLLFFVDMKGVIISRLWFIHNL
jgi:hypothetical protein